MADSTNYTKWLERANQDLKLLHILKTEGMEGLEEAFCYNCHQAVEKLLKAYLMYKKKSLIRTHDLVYLLGKCLRYDKSFNNIRDEITVLNEYSVVTRYPNDFGDMITLDEAKQAYKYVSKVTEHVLSRIY